MVHWTCFDTRDNFEELPVDDWTWEECMTWLICEGCYSCAMEYLTPEEAHEEVLMQKEILRDQYEPTHQNRMDRLQRESNHGL